MKMEQELTKMMKTDESIPTPNFDRMWDNIQKSKAPKKKINYKLWTTAAISFLAVSIATASNADKIAELINIQTDNGKSITLVNENPFHPEVTPPTSSSNQLESDSVSNGLNPDPELVKKVMGFEPVKPAYLPEGFRYTNDQLVKGGPIYNMDGEEIGLDIYEPWYTLHYDNGSKQGGLEVWYDIDFVSKEVIQKVPRSNPDPIEINGLKGVTHDNGIIVYKDLGHSNQLKIEILVYDPLPREEYIKMMESIVKNL
jgi:hypothetical protein